MRQIIVSPLTITAALTGVIAGLVSDFPVHGKMIAEANFIYGSGGTSVKAWVQTSFDGGVTWNDIMAFAFTTSSARKAMAVRHAAQATPFTITDAALADDTTRDNMIGDQTRVKVTTVGTYAGDTTLEINIIALQ